MREGLGAIWRHLQPFRRELTVLSILGLISAAANGSVPYITGQFFDGLIQLSLGSSDYLYAHLPKWIIFLIIWSAAQILANNADWLIDRNRSKLTDKLYFKIQSDGFAHFFHLPLSYHKNVQINGALQKISQTWRITEVARNAITIAPQVLSILVGLALAASINVVFAGILVVGVLLYVTLLLRILRPIAAIELSAHKEMNDGWDNAAAAVMQIESVKQAATEDYETKKIKDVFLNRAFDLWYRLGRHWSNVSFYQRIIVFLTQLTIFVLSARLVASGGLTVGQLIALNGYAMMFFGPFVALGHSWQTIQNGITAAANTEDIFREKLEDYHPAHAQAMQSSAGNIVFDQVSFAYSADQAAILKNINLEIKTGEVVALVGESGVGKSTTISLISAYYFPTAGTVTVGGVDTRQLDLKELRSQIAVVPQEVALFNDTIETNIKYGNFQATPEQVEAAAKKAHALEFIEKFPEKWQQVVGERGIKLSVGQKQRVAIARAILRDPKILILDEPTSALDAQTEKIIQTSLEELMKGRTTFIIAHRLSTVRRADKILVFRDGEIVEAGKHDELVKIENGVYRRLFELQIGLHN